MGVTCEQDCAELSWKYVEVQLILFGGLWVVLFIGGFSLCGYSVTNDVDDLKEKVDVLLGKMRHSQIYITLCMVLAIFQCGIFCLRTFTKTVDGISFLLELLACSLYFSNFILTWLSKSLSGAFQLTTFMFGWGFVDTLLFPSVLCLMGSPSWFSFSFVASMHILDCWDWWLSARRINLQELKWQIIDGTLNIAVLTFFAAMMMMSLENLGDPSWLSGLNDGKWNTLSAIYYVLATISTVGYGDLAPVTGLGRLFAIVTIFVGILSVVLALYKILQVMSLNSSGGGHFTPRLVSRHIVVSGNPTTGMALDFIAEVFHPDHAEDSEDLHLVFLLPRGTRTMQAILREMRQRDNVRVAPRVHVFQGSVLERHDLARVAPMQATAFFVLPDVQCRDFMHEDTQNIIRMMAVLKIHPALRTILLLCKAENKQLLHEAGASQGSNITCLAIDQFKLELVGKSCQVPGFATLICNLFKTISDKEDEDYSNCAWLQDYDKGAGNEIYEVELSATYAQRGAVFSEVVLDVIEQTDGAVYLIGLIETSGVGSKKVIVNPGTWYPIKDMKFAGVLTSGIFIAADREAVQQCEGGRVFLGRKTDGADHRKAASGNADNSERRKIKASAEKKLTAKADEALKAKGNESHGEEALYQDPLEDMLRRDPNLTREMQASARKLIQLAKQQRKAAEPERMPLKALASGGHILFLCIGLHDTEELRLGIEHFLKPLRDLPGPLAVEPHLLIMAPVPPRDWQRVSHDQKVFFMRGSPLSLFDLERANFRHASAIIIFNVGSARETLSEAWMADSDIICCARLIESELPVNSQLSVIAEIAIETNHPFIPLPGLTASGESARPGKTPAAEPGGVDLQFMPEVCPQCGEPQQEGAMACFACGAMPGDEPEPEKKSMKMFRLLSQKPQAVTEYYRQARYACGQLFVGNVVTSLTVNTFFNPSLWELVHQMIKAEVVMVPLPRDWEGKSYYEYFDKLLREDELMAVAIYRRSEAHQEDKKAASKDRGRKWSYVYTAPPAKETHMQRGDRVICFASAFKIREEDLEPVKDQSRTMVTLGKEREV